MNRAVFLDRDGVLNEAVVRDGRPFSPASLNELRITADASSSLERLAQSGFVLICVTNQPDVARGLQQREVVEEIHRALVRSLPLARIFTCFHDNADRCGCRKPEPGMLFDGARDLDVDLGRSFMIGDRWVDVEAGARAGCKTIWIDRAYDEPWKGRAPDHRAASLAQATDWILVNQGERP